MPSLWSQGNSTGGVWGWARGLGQIQLSKSFNILARWHLRGWGKWPWIWDRPRLRTKKAMRKLTSGPGNLEGTVSLSRDVNIDILKEADENKFTPHHACIQVGVRATVTLIRWHKPRPRKWLQMLARNLKASQGGGWGDSACGCVGVREHTHAHTHTHTCMHDRHPDNTRVFWTSRHNK